MIQCLQREAGGGSFTLHDFRRFCITNWARVLLIHVVLKLAGHSDIKTTQRYYLATQQYDSEKAGEVQSKIPRSYCTDPKLTSSPKNEGISKPKRKIE